MKTQKLSLANLKEKLSRNELKSIIGGFIDPGPITKCIECVGSPGNVLCTNTLPPGNLHIYCGRTYGVVGFTYVQDCDPVCG